MLTFKEYVENKDELDESMLSVAKAVGGFGGNLLGQTARGFGNIIQGPGNAVLGALGAAGDVVSGSAHAMLGDKEKSSKSFRRAGNRISVAASGVGDTVKGAAQLGGALTGITPSLRAIQASSEEGMSPLSKDRSSNQKLFGLNATQVPKEKERKIKRSLIQRPKIEDLFVLSPVTNSVNVERYIDQAYEISKKGEKKVITYDAKEFIKNILISYGNYKNKNSKTEEKLKHILEEYFPGHKILKIRSLESLNIQMNPENILQIKKFIDSIINLEIDSPGSDTTYVPGDSVQLRSDLIKLHNEVLNPKDFNKNLSGEIKELKKQVVRILNYYYPEKPIKLVKIRNAAG